VSTVKLELYQLKFHLHHQVALVKLHWMLLAQDWLSAAKMIRAGDSDLYNFDRRAVLLYLVSV
jgi:hypothetical protein